MFRKPGHGWSLQETAVLSLLLLIGNMMKNLLDRVKEKGEEQFQHLTSEILGNERLMNAVETVLNTKGYFERKVGVVLNTMNLASRVDVDEINGTLKAQERRLKQLTKKLELMNRKLGEWMAKNEDLAGAVMAANRRVEALTVELASAKAKPVTASKRKRSPAKKTKGRSTAKRPKQGSLAKSTATSREMEEMCPVCHKRFRKKTYNQRYCSAKCRTAG